MLARSSQLKPIFHAVEMHMKRATWTLQHDRLVITLVKTDAAFNLVVVIFDIWTWLKSSELEDMLASGTLATDRTAGDLSVISQGTWFLRSMAAVMD